MDPVDDPERTARGATVWSTGDLDGAALELVPAQVRGSPAGAVQDQRSEADQQEHGRQQSERDAARGVDIGAKAPTARAATAIAPE